MANIILEGMEFYAYHGCFKEEQIIGTKFLVDLDLTYDTTEAENTDELLKTLNYQHLYMVVKEAMNIKSHLLENVATRIINSIKDEYPSIQNIKVKVSKINPPLGGKMDKVSIVLSK